MSVLLGLAVCVGFCHQGIQCFVSTSGCRTSVHKSCRKSVCCSEAYCRHQMSLLRKKMLSSHLFVCLTAP